MNTTTMRTLIAEVVPAWMLPVDVASNPGRPEEDPIPPPTWIPDVQEPEGPEQLPDEIPNPNPDENQEPPLRANSPTPTTPPGPFPDPDPQPSPPPGPNPAPMPPDPLPR